MASFNSRQDVEIHNLAVRICDALNKEGAGLDHLAIGIIKREIERSIQNTDLGLTPWQKEEVRQMIQNALDTGSA